MANDSQSKAAGWPFDNYAVNLRRWDTGLSGAGGTRVAIMTPRHKFTFFAEFVLGPGVSKMVTDCLAFLEDETLYANLKAIDLPKVKLATDNLRSYNRNYKIQKKIEYEPFTMRFYDDSTSMVMALAKDMLHFVNHSAEIGGDRRKSTSNTTYMSEFSKFTHNMTGVGSLAGTNAEMIRSQMDSRPSLGMRLRECGRVFFESITIYDLGTEPDSINIYTYYNPQLVSIDPDGRDQSESGVAEVSMTFEYEDYSFTVGQPKNSVKGYIDRQLSVDGSPNYSSADGHAIMDDFDNGEDPACVADGCAVGGISNNPDLTGSTLERITLGSGIFTDNTNNAVDGAFGTNGIQSALNPMTGQPYTELDYGNNASAALNFYRDRLLSAEQSYAQIAGKGILSPSVEQYRLEQIQVLSQQVLALQTYNAAVNATSVVGGALGSALANTTFALISGPISTITPPIETGLYENVEAQQQILFQKLALEAAAQSEDQARQTALNQQSLASTPAENAQLAETAEFHREQAIYLRQQAAALTAPVQFGTYDPRLYGTFDSNAGGVVSAVTRAVAIQAIGNFLGQGGV